MAGAFYAFINVRRHLGRNYGGKRVDNSAQWCLTLLEQQNVATVMGSAFGAEGYAQDFVRHELGETCARVLTGSKRL